jgi:hypothetical protein
VADSMMAPEAALTMTHLTAVVPMSTPKRNAFASSAPFAGVDGWLNPCLCAAAAASARCHP